MNNSSQEPIFTITLNDEQKSVNDVEFPLNSTLPALTTADIVTFTGSSMNSGSYNYSTIETIDLSSIEAFSSFTNIYLDEFDGRFPDYERVQEMCKEYPGLEIAYRKFKEVYKMVKEDFDGKERERRERK